MNDFEAIKLDKISISEYLTLYHDDTSVEVLEANEILQNKNFEKTKAKILAYIKKNIENIENYKATRQAQIYNLEDDIELRLSELSTMSYNDFNNYIILVFRAAEQKIDKNISMLDFLNLEKQIIESSKKNNSSNNF